MFSHSGLILALFGGGAYNRRFASNVEVWINCANLYITLVQAGLQNGRHEFIHLLCFIIFEEQHFFNETVQDYPQMGSHYQIRSFLAMHKVT